MALVAFAMLLTTSLLQPCAGDAQASSTLKAIMSSLRRRDAKELKELRKKFDRRLTDDSMVSSTCLAACPDLQTMQNDLMAAILSNMPEDLQNGGDTSDMDMSFMTAVMEATLDAYCANKAAIECAVENPTACAEDVSDDGNAVGMGALAPSLDCFCDVCPSAKTAYIDFFGLFVDVVDGLSNMSFQFTTPQPVDVGTTELDFGDFDGNPFDDMTDQEKETMCTMYPIFNCAVTYPTECGADALSSTMNMTSDVSDFMVSLMGDECPTTPTPAPTSDDTRDDTGGTTASSCMSIGLGWLSVSLLPALATLTLEAAR
jgi:hypothetical protein